MVTKLCISLLSVIPLLPTTELLAQNRFSIGGNAGYYNVLGGRLFDEGSVEGALGFEALAHWETKPVTLGGALQYISYSSASAVEDVDRHFICLLIDGRYFFGGGDIEPFIGARAGVTFYTASGALWYSEGIAAGGVGGIRIRAGSGLGIDVGIGVTTVKVGAVFDDSSSEAGTWLSLFAGVTAAFTLGG